MTENVDAEVQLSPDINIHLSHEDADAKKVEVLSDDVVETSPSNSSITVTAKVDDENQIPISSYSNQVIDAIDASFPSESSSNTFVAETSVTVASEEEVSTASVPAKPPRPTELAPEISENVSSEVAPVPMKPPRPNESPVDSPNQSRLSMRLFERIGGSPQSNGSPQSDDSTVELPVSAAADTSESTIAPSKKASRMSFSESIRMSFSGIPSFGGSTSGRSEPRRQSFLASDGLISAYDAARKAASEGSSRASMSDTRASGSWGAIGSSSRRRSSIPTIIGTEGAGDSLQSKMHGTCLCRISTRSVVLKDWKPCLWVIEASVSNKDIQELLVFRDTEAYNAFYENPYMDDETKNCILKGRFELTFAYNVKHLTNKLFYGQVIRCFTLEKETQYGTQMCVKFGHTENAPMLELRSRLYDLIQEQKVHAVDGLSSSPSEASTGDGLSNSLSEFWKSEE